jgi:hypothetical protein
MAGVIELRPLQHRERSQMVRGRPACQRVPSRMMGQRQANGEWDGWVRVGKAAQILDVHPDTLKTKYEGDTSRLRKKGRFWMFRLDPLVDTVAAPEGSDGFVRGWHIALDDHIQLKATVMAQAKVIIYLERLVPALNGLADPLKETASG